MPDSMGLEPGAFCAHDSKLFLVSRLPADLGIGPPKRPSILHVRSDLHSEFLTRRRHIATNPLLDERIDEILCQPRPLCTHVGIAFRLGCVHSIG